MLLQNPRPDLHHATLAHPLRAVVNMVILLLFTLLVRPAMADETLDATRLPSGPIGASAQQYVETSDTALDLDTIIQRFEQRAFSPAAAKVLAAGIDAPAVWQHWRVHNPADAPVRLRLTVDNSWVDDLTAAMVVDGRTSAEWTAGDAQRYDSRPIALLGFGFEHDFAPGFTDVYLRAQTPDPLLLPVYLEPPTTADARQRQAAYFHAAVYGFLMALIAYNLLIWTGVRKRSHLLYAVYLSCFVLMSLAYTGHGYVWLWPNRPDVQHFIILAMMVAFAVTGLVFALRFLDVREHSPRLANGVRSVCWALIAAMTGAIMFKAQAFAASVAFVAVCGLPTFMIGLGLLALRRGVNIAGYFLIATTFGMLGALVTALTVLGAIPYSDLGFRAAEIGMLVDATLLALALAQRLRHTEFHRQRAEALARIDPLTHLLNRRAFHEQAGSLWHAAVRNDRPLSVIMLDVDYFKQLNDNHGHAMGDRALQAVADILSTSARRSDLVTRWGGEEFALLLPETDGHAAEQLAERLRLLISALRLDGATRPVSLSASFGVCERRLADSLDTLITQADDQLRLAKRNGRNTVMASRAHARLVVGLDTAGDA